jgi:membrane protein
VIERARARWSVVDVGVQTFKNFSAVDGGTYSAALTYYFFFSIFPLLLFAASILGYLTLGNNELRQDILDAGLRSVPLLKSVLSKDTLATIEENRGSIAVTGVVLALYSGSGAIVALGHALNRILGVEQERNFLGKRLNSLLWLAVLGLGAVVSLGLGGLAGYATKFFDGTVSSILSRLLGHGVGFVVGAGVFATAYRFLPNKPQTWSDVLPGACVAAAAFEILKEMGAWYLEQGAGGREKTFGTLAAAAGLLVASYLIAQITLLAASFNEVLAERRLTRQSSGLHDKGGHDG